MATLECTWLHYKFKRARNRPFLSKQRGVWLKMTLDEALNRLEKSKFRSKFHLSRADREYIAKKSIDTVRAHAVDFVAQRLAPAKIANDGAQTPWRGHPVFVAQHATATCCRGCIEKWYKIPKNTTLSPTQQQKIVNLIMYWIEKEIERK